MLQCSISCYNGLNFYFTGLLVKFHQFCFADGLLQQNQHRILRIKVNTIFREISSSDGFLLLLSSHTFCLRICGRNELCHFTLWHNCCVKQTICSLSFKNYSKVNTIIFSSAVVWLLQTFFFFTFSPENLFMSVLQVSDVLWGLCSVCSVCLQRASAGC